MKRANVRRFGDWSSDVCSSDLVAKSLALDLAAAGGTEHRRDVPHMTSLDEATRQARAAGADPMTPSLLFADPADNPGGGGRGNTTYILAAFLKAEIGRAHV